MPVLRKIGWTFAVALAAFLCSPAMAQQLGEPVAPNDTMPFGNKAKDPAFDLPAGSTLISSFGERPVFSPDGGKVAFVGEAFGDVFEYDLRSGSIRNLTAHMPHKGFLRVHYLADGSYLLLGPHRMGKTKEETRFGMTELWWLDAQATRPAQRLGVTVVEGIATSRERNRIAWAEVPDRTDKNGAGGSPTIVMKTADVTMANGVAGLANAKEVLRSQDVPGCYFEAQDFLPGDKGLTFPCYSKPHRVMSVDFATRKVTTYPTPPQLYAEVEGIFPDGRHTLVECSGDQPAGMDICLLELKAQNPSYRRLTRIMDYGRRKFGNPVVSPDGRTIAMSIGRAVETAAEAGAGEGIVLMRLPRNP